VTLEPCAFHGRTPPCCEAVVAAGIKKIYCAMRDPDSRVDGKGFNHLANTASR
jgi:diaminohydroxyphosphoribosylaminopyrimidine deaminase/5-amino-6-(5-phosphoribosylamino)uracil reductase